MNPLPPSAARRLGPTTRAVAVPTLADAGSGVLLRGHTDDDLPRIVEEARDPLTRAWTNVPVPDGGYDVAHARAFLDAVRAGWADRTALAWAVSRGGPYLGTINLTVLSADRTDLSYVLHPDARGQATMSAAVRLVVGYAFDVVGAAVVRWQAYAGNDASLRVATAAGFAFEGTQRLAAEHHGEPRDVWSAGLLRPGSSAR